MTAASLRDILNTPALFPLFIIGYNCLVAASIIPFAMSIGCLTKFIPAHMPVSIFSSTTYFFFEVTVFFLERSWSRVGIHFWCISFPFVICNLLLSLTLAYDNSFGCLLFAALCLGIRETAFELCVMGKLDAMERLMIGFMNGFLFSILMALSFAASYALIHVMLYQILMPPLVFQCLFALCLPLARGLLQMLVAHFLSSAAILLRDVEDFSHVPQFDSLVIYADVAFVMWMMLQVPCAFFILVVPNVVTFGVAASSNVVIDIFFVHALDALQKQRRKPCISTEENTPKFCMERPVSVVATLMGGRLGDGRLSEDRKSVV